jgi:hypothetical protein
MSDKEIIEVKNLPEIKNLPESNINLLIEKAIDKGLTIDYLERLLAMRKELETEFSRKEYDKSMSLFQEECPVIEKIKEGAKTKSGVVAYHYAPLNYIILKVKPLIGKFGFSYVFNSETIEKNETVNEKVISKTMVKVTCTISHIAGYSKIHVIEIPLGIKTDIMSESQRVAAALTFAKRYSFIDGFGIATGEDEEALLKDKDQKETTTNQDIFLTSWKYFEDSIKLLESKFSEQEKIQLKKVIFAKESGNLSIDFLNGMIQNLEKKYPEIKKEEEIKAMPGLFNIDTGTSNSKIEPDLKLDIGGEEK